MTLRLRLMSALAGVAALVTVAFVVLVVRQHSVLLDPLDDQLDAVAQSLPDADVFFRSTSAPPSGGDDGPPTGELLVAIVEANQDPLVLVAPASDPSFWPLIDISGLASTQRPDEPFSVDAMGGGGARVVARNLGDGRWAIAALSTAAVEDAQRELLITAAVVLAVLLGLLGLVMYFVDRLGIKPILEVAQAAEKLANTKSEPRVDVLALSTEAGRLGLSFNKMLDAHQDADAQQRRFIADASHELRTPLTTLQGYAALHANGTLETPEQVDDAMRRIGAEAKRMGRLVDELLTLASLDEGRPVSKTDIDLSLLLHDLAKDASAIQPDRKISTAVEADLRIHADLELLTQAITTTIRNALRHTPPSAGLALRAVRNGSTIRIDIADRGAGIDPAHLPHIFDRFYRPHEGRERAAGGTGIGLAIAKSVVEAHGGTIRAASTPGSGTTIVFELPMKPSGSGVTV